MLSGVVVVAALLRSVDAAQRRSAAHRSAPVAARAPTRGRAANTTGPRAPRQASHAVELVVLVTTAHRSGGLGTATKQAHASAARNPPPSAFFCAPLSLDRNKQELKVAPDVDFRMRENQEDHLEETIV